MPFYRGKSFAKNFDKRIEVLFPGGDANFLRDDSCFIKYCESFAVECDFECGFVSLFFEFDIEV